MFFRIICFLSLIFICSAGFAVEPLSGTPDFDLVEGDDGGIVFECPGTDLNRLSEDIYSFLRSLGITSNQIQELREDTHGFIKFSLDRADSSTDTLGLINDPELELREEVVALPSASRKPNYVVTVSRKEILATMLQHGRTTRFTNGSCSIEALTDYVGIRQNIVAWTEAVDWKWPDGNPAKWNTKYWHHGNFNFKYPLHEAIMDVFIYPEKYSFGCYTASKFVLIQGILDYYRRIKQDRKMTSLIEKQLLKDKDPLSSIEPGSMWFFEWDADKEDLLRLGKLVYLQNNVPSNNFIPGDWGYFLNTDPETSQKTGYEGSNAIYLGRGKFSDFYNDNNHSYTYKEKISEVYLWRNHVFSRSRDVEKITPLSQKEIGRLGLTPEEGGLQLNYRAVPYRFGFEDLP